MSVKAGSIGELEAAVLEVLWGSAGGLSVRDVLQKIRRRPPLAYTTVLTVLDRLHGKGLVVREKQGKAFHYAAAMTRESWFGERAAQELSHAGAGGEAVLMAFLDSTERAAPELLDKLSALIAARRRGRSR